MSQQELLIKVLEVLGRLGIRSMLTGSWASSLHGVPRATHDVDLLVEFNSTQIAPLAREFPPPDFYLSESAMRSALLKQGGMFNLLHTMTGDKVDFWILSNSEFDRSRFARKEVGQLADVSLCIPTAEDTILAKLRWSKECGGSEKQFGDALQIYELQPASLDHEYLRHWVHELQIEEEFQRLLVRCENNNDDESPQPPS